MLLEARDAVREALFVFDVGRSVWQRELKEFINLPLGEIQRLWAEKGPKRAAFAEKYVLGPAKPRAAVIEWLERDMGLAP